MKEDTGHLTPAEALEQMLADLRPIADLELSLGNSIRHVEVDAYTRCKLAVVFEKPLHFDKVKARLKLPETITTWENNDPHYSFEAGFMDETARHSLAGPIPKKFFGLF